MLIIAWLGLGCGSRSVTETPEEPVEETLPVATMYRLTDAEYRSTVSAVFGVDYDGALPDDFSLHGYRSVGAGSLTVSPSELEAYEAAAWSVANAAVPDRDAVVAHLGCRPGTPLGHPVDDRLACVASGVAPLAARAWRRPLERSELDRLVDLFRLTDQVTDEVTATRAVVAALVLAPAFLYRVEVGEPDPTAEGARRYTAWELASRLAYFLTDAPPDEALRAAAERGELHDPGVLAEHAGRLFDTPAGRAAMARFWEETLELDRLDATAKDPEAFPGFDADLRGAMRVEVRRMFDHVVFETGQPFGNLLTTDVTFVNPELAQLYGVPGGSGTVRASLEGSDRGGVLGRAAVLSIWSHATSTSPTLRGKFVRSRMLCQSIPPPPEGVVASLDAVTGEGSARERLAAHSDDPACRACHEIMDPPGFAFEHYDAIGRYRSDDGGYAIDPSGDLDGAAFASARELGAAVAAHEDFPVCMALQLFRHAMGAAEEEGHLPEIERLGSAFAEADQSLRALVVALVQTDAFRRTTPAEGRPAVCGSGLEICNGVDDDCDGEIDEDGVLSCEIDGVAGVSDCAARSCEVPPPDVEVCNRIDDDRDGSIDEGAVLVTPVAWRELPGCLPGDGGPGCRTAAADVCGDCGAEGFVTGVQTPDEVAVSCVSDAIAAREAVSFGALAAQHAGCTAASPGGPDCNAAIHRHCASTGHVTGYGPVAVDDAGASVVCLDEAAVRETTYDALAGLDPGCDGVVERMGPACDRAFHRWCQGEGFASGLGPLENFGDGAVAACVGEVP